MEMETSDHQLAGVIIFIAGLTCLIVDGGVALLQHFLKPLTGCAAVLYNSMVITECVNMCFFVLFVGPALFFSDTDISHSIIGRKLGHFFVFGWITVVLLTLALSANRYLAICQPVKYRAWCTVRTGLWQVAFCYFVALLNTLAYFFETCDWYVQVKWLGPNYFKSKCGVFLWWHCTGACSTGILILTVFNVLTFMKIKKSQPPLTTISPTLNDNTNANTYVRGKKDNDRRKAIEVRFFIQAALNALAMEGMIVSYHLLGLLCHSPWGMLLTGHLPLLMTNGTNGFLMLAVNVDLRKAIKNRFFRG